MRQSGDIALNPSGNRPLRRFLNRHLVEGCVMAFKYSISIFCTNNFWKYDH